MTPVWVREVLPSARCRRLTLPRIRAGFAFSSANPIRIASLAIERRGIGIFAHIASSASMSSGLRRIEMRSVSFRVRAIARSSRKRSASSPLVDHDPKTNPPRRRGRCSRAVLAPKEHRSNDLRAPSSPTLRLPPLIRERRADLTERPPLAPEAVDQVDGGPLLQDACHESPAFFVRPLLAPPAECLSAEQDAGRLQMREGVARAFAYARKRIAERLGEIAREQGGEVREHRAALDKTERAIAKLVDFITEGNGTKAVSEKLKVLEREADTQRKALATLERLSAAPIKLPTPDAMVQMVFALERRLLADVTRGREELRRLFRDGRIDLIPQEGGFYIARSEILPLVLLTTPPSEANQGGRIGNHEVSRYSAIGCAGRI